MIGAMSLVKVSNFAGLGGFSPDGKPITGHPAAISTPKANNLCNQHVMIFKKQGGKRPVGLRQALPDRHAFVELQLRKQIC